MKKIFIILISFLLLSITSMTVAEATDDNDQKTALLAPSTQKEDPPEWADTAYGQRMYQQEQVADNNYAISLFQPNYILPFYYTFTPDEKVYGTTTPDDQRVMRQEFEAQLSFELPVIDNLFNKDSSLDVAYTQLMIWQVYAASQYFRETDYMPEVFVTQHYGEHWTGRYSIVHQSNGRGGDMERSWNRVYAETIYSQKAWMVSVKPWMPIFQHESITVHNPDIMHYMGYGSVTAAYQTQNNLVLSLMTRNNLESGFSRGAEEMDMSFPLYRHFRGMVKVFSGYGQSLIEYNHYTNAIGVGVMINDWI